MSLLKAILLGIFQGLTEFLPVSSSGHIMLASEVLGVELEGGVLSALTVILHLGTFFAVFILYFERVWKLLMHPIKGELKWLVVATLPTVIYALVLKATGWDDVVDATARTLLPYAFLLTAVFLLLADGIGKNRKKAKNTHKQVGFGDALSMGLMQCVGTFTGVSRSGSTITGGLASGLDAQNSADFSFLMSLPAILGAAVLDIMSDAGDLHALGEFLPETLAGVIAAFVAGLIAIKLMLSVIKKMRLKWFSLYLALIAGLIIVNDYIIALW